MITEFRRHGGGRTVWNSDGKGGLSILEFPKARGGLDEDAACGRVWIFSGITHCFELLIATFRLQSGPVREQHLIVGITMRIEMHQ